MGGCVCGRRGRGGCIVSLHGDPLKHERYTQGYFFFIHSFCFGARYTSPLLPLIYTVTQNAYTRIKIDLNTLGQIMRLEDARWMESNKPNRLSELIVAVMLTIMA